MGPNLSRRTDFRIRPFSRDGFGDPSYATRHFSCVGLLAIQPASPSAQGRWGRQLVCNNDGQRTAAAMASTFRGPLAPGYCDIFYLTLNTRENHCMATPAWPWRPLGLKWMRTGPTLAGPLLTPPSDRDDLSARTRRSLPRSCLWFPEASARQTARITGKCTGKSGTCRLDVRLAP